MKAPLGADEVARPGRQALEGDAVALGLLLDALGLEIVDDDGREILARQIRVGGRAPALGGSMSSISSSSLAGSTRWGDRLSTVNGPATRTRALST